VYTLEITNQYLRDLKLARKRNLDEEKLNQVIRILITGEILPPKYKDHNLTGVYQGFIECHVSPDWLIIYSKNKTIRLITLIRTGSHSDLFE
jgi:mRNA interferase YafQ